MVKKKSRKKQAEEHHETSNQVGHPTVPEDNPDEQADARSRQVEKNQDQNELKKLRPQGNQTSHRVDDNTHDDRRDQP